MEIKFYRERDPYGFLSNFYRAPIEIDGLIYPTTEHYFQAMKFVGTDYAEKIRLAAGPMTAARLGRSRKHKLRIDWELVKEDIMLKALRAKFRQHHSLWGGLLQTGDAILIEHTANDRYWGDGGDGSGKNRLGVLLMKVRDEFRSKL